MFNNFLAARRIEDSVADLQREFGGRCYDWVPGMRVMHPTDGLVELVDGAYLRNGRVSNHWTWQRVKKDGSLFKEVKSGYGWA